MLNCGTVARRSRDGGIGKPTANCASGAVLKAHGGDIFCKAEICPFPRRSTHIENHTFFRAWSAALAHIKGRKYKAIRHTRQASIVPQAHSPLSS